MKIYRRCWWFNIGIRKSIQYTVVIPRDFCNHFVVLESVEMRESPFEEGANPKNIWYNPWAVGSWKLEGVFTAAHYRNPF